MTADDHERIWLEHPDTADPYNGRMWCGDKVWPESEGDGEPTEYVRADLLCRAKPAATPQEDLTEQLEFDF